jgi:hypothetical protein
VLDSEAGLHAEGGALLDGEGLGLERLESTGRRQVDDDVGTALNLDNKPESVAIFIALCKRSSYLESKGDDDDLAGIAGITNGGSRTDTQALLPLSQALIILICYFIVSNLGFEKQIANKIVTGSSKRGRSPKTHPAKNATQSRFPADFGLFAMASAFMLGILLASTKFLVIVQSTVARRYVSRSSRRTVTRDSIVCHCSYLLDLLGNCRSIGHVAAVDCHPKFSLAVLDTIYWRVGEPPTNLYC